GSHGGIIVDAPESPVNADSNSVLGSQAPAGGINDSITPDSGAPQVIANPGQIATTQSGGSDSNAPDPGVSSAASGDGNHNSEPDALAQNLVAQAAADGIGDSNAPGSGVPASDGAGKPKPTDGDSTAPHGVDPNSTAIGGETNPPPTITAENPESSAVTDETNTTSPIVDGSHENIVADAHESPVAADSNSDLGAQPPAVDGSVSITPDPSAHADDADGNHNAEHDALAQNLVAQALAGSVNDSSTSSLAGSSQVIVNPGQIATPPSDGNDSSAPDPGVSSAVSGDGSHNPGPDALTQNLGAQPPTGGANDSSTPNSDVSSAASSADKPKSPDGDSTAPQDAIAPDQAVLVAEADSPLTIDDESPESSAVFAIDAAKQCEEAARRIAELNHAAENTHQLLVSDSLTGRTNGNKAQLAALRAAASVISKSLLAESVESFFVKNPCGAVVVLGALTVLDSKKVNEKKACAYILEFILHILREPSGEALSAIAPLLPACLVAKDHISADAISALCFGELLKNGSLSFLNGMHTNANIALSLDHEGGAKFLEELARTLPSELLKASSTERKSAIDNLAVFLSATTPKHAIILRTLIFEALAIVLKAGNNDDASLKHLSHLLNVITEPHDASFPMTCDHAPAKPPTDLVVANQPTGSLASLFGKRERNPELLVRP
ncbi:MAG: hypothetical protein LBI39_02600, partial [Puniceicoccales bacterium]|nr:hypothetical protein [Puniceicoccales bacterium]